MVYFKDGNTYIENDGFFDIDRIFDCGQCFRFDKTGNKWSGIAFGKRLCAYNENGCTVLENISESEYNEIWKIFFDMETDYGKINDLLSKDNEVRDALKYACGIRILKQEKWETLCSFIISQNNNIPRIKKIVGSLCENFGDNIGNGYSFPKPQKLLEIGEEGLSVIKSGFRARYIIDAASKVVSGDIDLEIIPSMDYETAKAYLMKIKGVGSKVADCTLLFGYGFFDAFPKDVWIKRVIDKYYGDSFDEEVFKPYGGIAQQYLFYRERYVNNVNA